MDKYSKALIMFIKIPIGIFCILIGLSLGLGGCLGGGSARTANTEKWLLVGK